MKFDAYFSYDSLYHYIGSLHSVNYRECARKYLWPYQATNTSACKAVMARYLLTKTASLGSVVTSVFRARQEAGQIITEAEEKLIWRIASYR